LIEGPVGLDNLHQLDTSNGCQDHTVLPSAASLNHTPRPARMLPEEVSAKAFKRRSSSRRPITHGITALRPLARPTLPRPPHSEPNVRDDRDTPLWRAGTGGVVGLIWGRREQVFLLRGLDSNQVICPSCQFAAGSSRWIYWTGESVKHASDLLVAQPARPVCGRQFQRTIRRATATRTTPP